MNKIDSEHQQQAVNLIDTNIKPDPFDPQRGDVYESGGPFPQRIVVELQPNSEDPRIRYRVDGGADSNLTTLGQFHLHLAGLGELRGVGRVRDYPPATPDATRLLVHQLRVTALGVDRVTSGLMRGAAATIAEQAAVIAQDQEEIGEMHKRFSAHERALVTLGFPPGEDPEQWASRAHTQNDLDYQTELSHRLNLQKSLAEMRDGLLEAEQKIRTTPLAYNDSTEPLAVARRIVDEVTALKAGLAEAEANNAELAKFVQAHGEPVPVELHPFANLSVADIGHAAWLCGYHPGDDPRKVFATAAKRGLEWLEIEALLAADLKTAREEDPTCTVESLVESLRDGYQQLRIKNDHLIADKAEQANELERLKKLLAETADRFSALVDAVAGSGQNGPRSDADLIRAATNARQVSDQVRVAVRLLGFEWDDSKADAGHALIEAVRAERKVASDLALELDSISAFIAPHGVSMPAGTAKPTSLDLVRWLAVTGGVVPYACHPTLAEVQEAQEVDFRARWDRYESAKRKPANDEPARPECGEVDHFPSVAETRVLGLRAKVHRAVAQLREISEQNAWPVRERLLNAAVVMLEQATLRTADDSLQNRPPGERLTWVPRFNNGNGGASITLDGRTVFVSGAMARELSEALFRHQHVLAASREERDNAILQRDDARSKLMAATEIIDFVWPRLERAAGLNGLERDLINAATLFTYLPGGVNHRSSASVATQAPTWQTPVYCTGFVTILAVKDRKIVQRQSWTSDRPDFKATDVSFHDDDGRFAFAEDLDLGDRQGTWTWRGSMGSLPLGNFPDKRWQGEWEEETT